MSLPSRDIEIELTTVQSNYHVEMNPSDVGNQDRHIVQEVIKARACLPSLLPTSTCCTPARGCLKPFKRSPTESSRVHMTRQIGPCVCGGSRNGQNKPLHQSSVCMCLQDMSKNRPLELKGTRAYKVSHQALAYCAQ